MAVGTDKTATDAGCMRYFADVQIAARIGPDIVRSEKVAWRAGLAAASPACQQLAVCRKDAYSSASRVGRGWLVACKHPGKISQLGHEHALARVDKYLARPRSIVPKCDKLSLRCKNLDAAVFAIGKVD